MKVLAFLHIFRCMESGKNKCAQYWPTGRMEHFTSAERVVEVEKINETPLNNIVIRQLSIRPTSPSQVYSLSYSRLKFYHE